MFYFLKIFLLFISLYHVFNTFFVYGIFGGQHGALFSSLKEILWIGFVLIMIFIYRNKLIPFLKNYLKTFLALVFLMIWGFLISYLNHKGITDMIVGFKYDLLYLVIFFSSLFLGYIQIENKNFQVNKFLQYTFKLIVFVLILGFFYQLGKHVFPEMYFKIGYGPVGDYIHGKNPPIFYRTGSGGLPRLSGFFSGPNNYGFFLVLFFSFFILAVVKDYFKSGISKFKKRVLTIIYLLFSFITLSRGVMIGLFLQMYYFVSKRFNISKKLQLIFVLFAIVLLIGISVYKYDSTMQHLHHTFYAIHTFLSNPLGYGMGTSGPSVHYNGYLLPENMYLQIMIDLGSIGFILWIYVFYSILMKKKSIIHDKSTGELVNSFYLGFFSLLIVGFFLHIFEDSMVNYLFFINFGIILGYLQNK